MEGGLWRFSQRKRRVLGSFSKEDERKPEGGRGPV